MTPPLRVYSNTDHATSVSGQAIQILVVVERVCLLDEFQDAEHAIAGFAVHFAELYGGAGARVESGDEAFRGQAGIIHGETELDLAAGVQDVTGLDVASAHADVGEIGEYGNSA